MSQFKVGSLLKVVGGFSSPQDAKFVIAEGVDGKTVLGTLSGVPSMVFDSEISRADSRYIDDLIDSQGMSESAITNRVNSVLKSMRRGSRVKHSNNLMKSVSRRRT